MTPPSAGTFGQSRVFESIVTAAGALALTVLAGAVLLVLGGHDPTAAAAAMLRGSVGSWSTFASITLVRSVPLILTGLAVALAFRAGVWNIGAEGQLYAGAVAAAFVALNGGALPRVLLVPAVRAPARAGRVLSVTRRPPADLRPDSA